MTTLRLGIIYHPLARTCDGQTGRIAFHTNYWINYVTNHILFPKHNKPPRKLLWSQSTNNINTYLTRMTLTTLRSFFKIINKLGGFLAAILYRNSLCTWYIRITINAWAVTGSAVWYKTLVCTHAGPDLRVIPSWRSQRVRLGAGAGATT